jgi:hypothetical protein
VPNGRATTPTPADNTPEMVQPMRMDTDGPEGGVTPSSTTNEQPTVREVAPESTEARHERIAARTPEEIADRKLRADALRIHRQFPSGRARNGSTVATADLDGHHVYSVSNNRTSRAIRQKAEELGYERIFGKQYTAENQTDAEQILLNYVEEMGGVESGRIAPSRRACGPERQNCAGRIDETSNVRLIGPRKAE